jgi:predicted Zn-dependent protease
MPFMTSFLPANAPAAPRQTTRPATRPLSLFTTATDPGPERYLTQAACEALFDRIRRLSRDGDTRVRITSRWRGTTRWVHNSLLASSDELEHRVSITRFINGTRGEATTNQVDDASLQIAVATAERQANREPLDFDSNFVSGAHAYLPVDLFTPATYNLDATTRAAAAGVLVAPAAATGVLAAGYLEVRANTIAVYDTGGLHAYAKSTAAQYTVTVRDAEGTASGWAGQDHADWTKIDAAALAKRALEKCLASKHPMQIEPGRYTVVLEPQAVHALMRVALGADVLMRSDNERSDLFPYNMRRPPRRGLGTSKIGVQIMDPRITVGTDPQDPDGGYVSFDQDGVPYTPVTWIEEGVLQQLPYDPAYALERLNSGVAHPYTASFRMSGGSPSVDEMIASTERGVLVTRFVGIRLRHTRSLLTTGTTADGTWLIEQGKRTQAIKNLRFNVSPLEAFNQVQELGTPHRVFSPDAPAIVPPAKLQDFHFTSGTDAI